MQIEQQPAGAHGDHMHELLPHVAQSRTGAQIELLGREWRDDRDELFLIEIPSLIDLGQ